MDLDLLDREVELRCASWAASGASWELTHGPETPKPAAWLALETHDGLGSLILWVSGEAELEWIRPTPGGDVRAERHEIADKHALRTCLDALEAHLGIRT